MKGILNKMVKNEMLKAVAAKVENMTQKDVDAVLKAFEEVVVETLTNDANEKIGLGNIGSFKVKDVPERRGIVRMGENAGSEWVKEAHKELVFKTSSAMKDI